MLRGYPVLVLGLGTLCALAHHGCTPVDKNSAAPHIGSETVIEELVLLRQMNGGDPGEWKEATSIIEGAGLHATDFLLKALRFDDGGERSARIREYAARRLGQLKAPGATVELAAALRDANPFVRSEVADALIFIKDGVVVPLILEMLESETRPGADAEMLMFEVLRSITGTFQGYEYRDGEEKRAEIIERCTVWWAAESRKDGE